MSTAELDRWAALKRIHEAVAEAPASEREKLLVELAGGDDDLLRDARSLLKACDEADARLPVPELETVDEWFGAPRSKTPPLDRRFGTFRLIRELAQGGMGVVFEAEQDEPRRRVALKVLRTGIDSESARLRFEHEGRVLGNLTHPGIGALYGVGEHESETGEHVPYLVMELVRGARPITEFARDEELSTNDRLQLFLEVAAAVAAGHQRGIIHRDLKPDNVLVDEEGRAKVIDFGIARVTAPDIDRGQVTETGLVMGTLGYIAPEQLNAGGAGDDVRMDVYALGVILYEMLTGHSPLDVAGLDILEAVRVTLERRPTPATRYVPSLSQDLVLILNKALAKEPEARYVSVEAFARDVSSFLKSEPIRARAPSWTYQLRLFTRRHRVGVMSSMLVAAALAGATWFSLRSASQARDAEQKATKSSERAEAMLLGSQDLVQSLVSDLYDELAKVPGTLPARLALVKRLESGADVLRVQAGDDNRLLRTAALVHQHVSMLNYRVTGDHLGRPGPALEAIGRSQEAVELLLADPTVDPVQRREDELMLAVLIGLRSDIHTYEGAGEAAVGSATEAVKRLEALHEVWPQELPIANTLASQQMRLARMEHRAGDDEAALARIKAAVSVLPEKEPADRKTAMSAYGNRGFLKLLAGQILRYQGKLEEAAVHAKAGLAAFLAEKALDPEGINIRIKLSLAYGELGLLARAAGDIDAAEGHLNEAIRVGREQLARNPEDRQARESLYVDMSYMAKVQDAKGNLDEAVRWQEESVKGGEQFANAHPDALYPQVELRVGLNQLGGYLLRGGQSDRAATVFERAHELAKRLIEKHPKEVSARLGWAEALDALGIARWSRAQKQEGDAKRALLVEAKRLFERSVDVHRAMEADGVLPATHKGAVKQIANKVSICEQNIAALDGGKAKE